ncbi:MAG: DUF2589 domain-containing protein [Lachnospiraceae bacterium]
MGIFIKKQKESKVENTPEQENQTLSDVIRGMQYCVNTAAEITEEHYLSQLSEYFDEEGNPVMFTYRNSRGEIVEIPVFTLMNHAELLLNEISVKMSLPIKYSELKRTEEEDKAIDNFVVSRSTFYLDNLATSSKGKGGEIEIEMRFKAGERPEAVSRIVDQLMNTGVIHTPEDKWKAEHPEMEEK